MVGKSCFFIGHRETSEEICPALYAAVEQHILEYGVTEFIVGHYGGFDHLAASAVKEAKRFYPEVKLTLLLPYHPAERPIPTTDGFDNTFYPPALESVPRKLAIVRANRYVVDHVDILSPMPGTLPAMHGRWWNMLRRDNGKTGIPITILTQVAI